MTGSIHKSPGLFTGFWLISIMQLFRCSPLVLHFSVLQFVAYWPPTQPSCQKKKCTCVNNRCIRSKISGDQGRPWLSRGWIKCEIVTLAGSRWVSNYYITPATGSSDQLERRCCNENHVPAEVGPLGPRLSSPGERERKAMIVRRVGGSICCSLCPVSNSLSHTTLSIKWEVYFSKKNYVRSSLLRRYISACKCVCIVSHVHTTQSLN